MKLVTNPEFHERENRYCEKVLANPVAINNGPAQGIELAQPIAEIEKHQPVPMRAPAPSMAPGPTERERGNELS